jgi:hypothetical protein
MAIDEQKIKVPDNKELRSFALTISVALGIVGALVLWRRGPMGFIFIAIGAVILFAGLVSPKSLTILYKVWMALALVLGLAMSHIILALVFYIVLSPIGFLIRILGKDPLTLRDDPKAESYWVKREKKEWHRDNYEKMY